MTIATSPRTRLSALAAGALLALAAHAQGLSPRPIDLPAAPLEQSLNTLARKTGVQIVFASPLAAGRTAPAVRGTLTPRQALEQVLAGSGLAVRVADGGQTYVVERAAAGSTSGNSATPGQTLSEVRVTAAAHASATTEGSPDYKARAITLGLGEQSMRETPNSISVVTRQRIEDQNFVTIEDAMQYATALKVTTYGTNNFQLESRGYGIDRYQIDGVPSSVRVYENNFSLAMFDRIEIWRGPAGLMQGAGDPGGTVNMVRKRAQNAFGFNARASVGSWRHYYGEADVTGPLNADGSLRGRLVAAYQDRHYFTDHAYSRVPMVYGTLEYDFSSQTTLSVGHSHQPTKNRPFFGVAAYEDGSYPDLTRSTFIGAIWNQQDQKADRSFAELEHRFDGGGKAVLSTNRTRRHNQGDIAWGNSMVDPATGDMLVVPYYSWRDENETNLHGQITLPLTWRGLPQELVLGASHQSFDSASAYNRLTWGQNGFTQNVFTPNPDVPKPVVAIDPPTSLPTQRQSALFGQARLRLWEPLTILVGGRVGWYETTDDLRPTSNQKVDAEFTPYAGAVLDLSGQWSVYGSYSSIFNPQSARNASGDFLKPRAGKQFEVGLKGEHFDQRLATSMALYRIEDVNRAIADPDHPDASIAAGKVRSQGLEAELTGRITPRWNITAGYGYNTTKVLRASPEQEGKPFTTVFPRHTFSLWTDYRFDGGWSLGGGARLRSAIYTEDAGLRWGQGSVAVFSAQAGWQATPKTRLTLTVNNLFDRKYIDRPDGWTRQTYYGEPRSLMAMVSYKY